jgi:hypothetical protein
MDRCPFYLCTNVAACIMLLPLPLVATAQQRIAVDDAVRVAEQFIQAGDYDTKRNCPESLQQADQARLFDMQRHCRNYDASEATAFAVSDEDRLFRVYFRKSPPEYYDGRESFRVVEVRLFENCPLNGCVALKDIELYLPDGARVLE